MKHNKSAADILNDTIEDLLHPATPLMEAKAQADPLETRDIRATDSVPLTPDTVRLLHDLNALAEATPLRDTFLSELEARLLLETVQPGSLMSEKQTLKGRTWLATRQATGGTKAMARSIRWPALLSRLSPLTAPFLLLLALATAMLAIVQIRTPNLPSPEPTITLPAAQVPQRESTTQPVVATSDETPTPSPTHPPAHVSVATHTLMPNHTPVPAHSPLPVHSPQAPQPTHSPMPTHTPMPTSIPTYMPTHAPATPSTPTTPQPESQHTSPPSHTSPSPPLAPTVLPLPVAATQPASVLRYGIFEQTFNWSGSHHNPWEEVSVTMTLTSPTQRSIGRLWAASTMLRAYGRLALPLPKRVTGFGAPSSPTGSIQPKLRATSGCWDRTGPALCARTPITAFAGSSIVALPTTRSASAIASLKT